MGGGLASPMARRAIMRAMMPYGLPNKPLSRRRFLTGAAGAGLALAVLPRPAAAAVF
ncbi:MAG: twin-arginine translocation signal domain-containing protein, partial [Rhodospirillaceae bacterium]|nr:twin-arginine translocation signal domain-containing protein [Rhodospirillaceae bacterium]